MAPNNAAPAEVTDAERALSAVLAEGVATVTTQDRAKALAARLRARGWVLERVSDSAAAARPDLGTQTNAEWVERLDVAQILGAAKQLLDVAQNLSRPHPNGYAAASVLQSLAEFLTGYAKPVGSDRDAR